MILQSVQHGGFDPCARPPPGRRRRRYRVLLSGQRNEQAGIIIARHRRCVWTFIVGCLHFRPFRPKVHACCRLDKIGNVRAADSRRSLQEVKLSVLMGANELRVRNAVLQAKASEQTLIHGRAALAASSPPRSRMRVVKTPPPCDTSIGGRP